MPTPRADASGGPGGPAGQVAYDPAADLRALLLRPWVLVGRLISISWQLLALAVVLAVRGNSSDAAEQQRLGKRIFTLLLLTRDHSRNCRLEQFKSRSPKDQRACHCN